MSYQYSFEKLDLWREARMFVSQVYTLTKKFPIGERFGLTSQIQRAAVSVASNIAEGVSRFSNKEKNRFLEISYGSLMEVYCQFCIALDLAYITEEQLNDQKKYIDKLANQLNALCRTIRKKMYADNYSSDKKNI
jgi:four helix bundle protein